MNFGSLSHFIASFLRGFLNRIALALKMKLAISYKEIRLHLSFFATSKSFPTIPQSRFYHKGIRGSLA